MPNTLVDVTDISKLYGPLRAVDGVSFTMSSGSVLAMVGPNGAGKTTTLRMIAGIVRPSSGGVRVAGVDVGARPIDAKRRLAWVPHDPQLFDAMSVIEHLEFTAGAWRVEGWRRRAEGLLERFSLADKRDGAAHTLSRGMRQKVALACAALHAPDVLLLDEPMTGLDPRAIRALKEWVREEARRGAAVIISSHLLSMVEDISGELAILQNGKLRFFGTLAEAHKQFSVQDLEEVFFEATKAN